MPKGRLNHDRGLTVRMVLVMVHLATVLVAAMLLIIGLLGGWGVLAVISCVVLLTAVWFTTGPKSMRSIGARMVDAETEPALYGALERMCALSGVPVPKLAVMTARDPNAFAFGRSRKHAVIVVTRPLVDLLEADEIEAVLAHELAHLAHRDLLVMSLASSPRILKSLFSGLLLDTGNPVIASISLGGWVFTAVLDLVVYLPMRLLSRYRELCADAAAAQLTQRPGSLASALQKITSGTNLIPSKDIRSSALIETFGIVASAEHSSGGLSSTHPTLDRRMAALARLGAELGRPSP